MATEFDTGLPSIRLVQNYIKEKKTVEVQLTTGEKLSGQLLWQDAACFCLQDEGEPTLIWRHSVVYLHPQS